MLVKGAPGDRRHFVLEFQFRDDREQSLNCQMNIATHWDWNKIADIFSEFMSKFIFKIKICAFQFMFQCCLFVMVQSTISLGYLLIYPPQIATVVKLISFCSKYNPVSHTKSLGESQEWNMVFQGNIWSRVEAFKKIYGFAHLATEGIFCT